MRRVRNTKRASSFLSGMPCSLLKTPEEPDRCTRVGLINPWRILEVCELIQGLEQLHEPWKILCEG